MLSISDYDVFLTFPSKVKEEDFKKYFDYDIQIKSDYNLMKHNFSRFWYYLGLQDRHKFIEFTGLDVKFYDEYNKLIKYVYDITIIEFDNKFTDGKCQELDFDWRADVVRLIYKFKHDLVLFWSGLTLELKEKFIKLVNEHEFTEGFNEQKEANYDESIYQNAHKNLDIYKKYKSFESPSSYIVHNYSQNSVDNLEPGIKKLEIISLNKITSLNYLPESVEELYISCPEVISYDDLPNNLKKLIIHQINEKATLNNLPSGLKELDISNSKKEDLNDCWPIGIEVLKCTSNSINEIKNLPNNLIYLNLSSNGIIKLENLPKNLIYFKCDNNLVEKIENIPENLEYLNLENNKITVLEGLNDKLVYLNLKNNLLTCLDLTNLERWVF